MCIQFVQIYRGTGQEVWTVTDFRVYYPLFSTVFTPFIGYSLHSFGITTEHNTNVEFTSYYYIHYHVLTHMIGYTIILIVYINLYIFHQYNLHNYIPYLCLWIISPFLFMKELLYHFTNTLEGHKLNVGYFIMPWILWKLSRLY